MKFLEGLDNDLKQAVFEELRSLWTHHSTALEGNSLNLSETQFVIREGLTVQGKPLKDHQEVMGHAKAIDQLLDFVSNKTQLSESDLFELHKSVQTQVSQDIYAPVGAWKNEPNGTYFLSDQPERQFLTFPLPKYTKALMQSWLAQFNQAVHDANQYDRQQALRVYTELHCLLVTIHPFADGNGRMARLLANVPVLKAGFVPIMVSRTDRKQYIECLQSLQSQLADGDLDALQHCQTIAWSSDSLTEIETFFGDSWQASWDLIDNAKKTQAKR